MFQIEIKLRFRSGHRLIKPYEGKCNNPHGEGYTAICIFEKEKLDKCGMIMDFGVAKKYIKEWLDKYWDHAFICHEDDEMKQVLQDRGHKIYVMCVNPTAENMVSDIWARLEHSLYSVNVFLVSLELYETESSCARKTNG